MCPHEEPCLILYLFDGISCDTIAHGCRKSGKAELVAKGIIRKIVDQPEQAAAADKRFDTV